MHYQCEADLLKGAEDHQQACLLQWQFHGLATTGDDVANLFATLQDLQYMAGLEAITSALVEHHYVVLADLRDAVEYLDDAALEGGFEVQWLEAVQWHSFSDR